MADLRLSELDAGDPSNEDYLYLVDDPDGTPTSKRASVADVIDVGAVGLMPDVGEYLVAPFMVRSFASTTISSSVDNSNGQVVAQPLWVSARMTIDALACEVGQAAAGSVDPVVKLGLYAANGHGPGALLGATAGLGVLTGGIKEGAIIPVTLERGLYFVAIVLLGHGDVHGATNNMTFFGFSGGYNGPGMYLPSVFNSNRIGIEGWNYSIVGAEPDGSEPLPADLSAAVASVTASGSKPRLWARRGA